MESSKAELGGGPAATQFLLRCGTLAGPFYLAVGLIQAFLRDGFDFGRHPLSVLANGPGGWVQTANFVLTGLMVLAAAIGFGRLPGPKARGVTYFLCTFGIAMIVAAAFPADPVDGFPPGTPKGPPTSISTTGLVHFAAGSLGFAALGISCFFAGWAMWRRRVSSLAIFSFLSGVGVLFGFFGGLVLPIGILGIWFAVFVGFAWLTILYLRLSHQT